MNDAEGMRRGREMQSREEPSYSGRGADLHWLMKK